MTISLGSRWWTGASASIGIAGLWLGLALTHPGTTYHFAPPLVAAAWPVAERWHRSGPAPPPAAAGSALAGSLVALAATGFLLARHALGGPTLRHSANAWVEVILGVGVGAVLGGVIAARGYHKIHTQPRTDIVQVSSDVGGPGLPRTHEKGSDESPAESTPNED
ncbi:MAG: hypothetical protein NVSMB32_07870 [Actinomycetota bacterium]